MQRLSRVTCPVAKPLIRVTFMLKFLVMMSHLPEPVFRQLKRFVRGVDDGLQAGVHTVDRAMSADRAFDHGYVASPLFRALLCSVGGEVASTNHLQFDELGNGGCEITITHQGYERRFRLKRAKFDARGFLDLRVSSDSLVTKTAIGMNRSLFDDDDVSTPPFEQWLLAYSLSPSTRVLQKVYATLPIGLVDPDSVSPYRLALGPVVPIPLITPTPPRFDGGREDLDLGDADEEEGFGEVA
jgi:hypothetical protein